MQNKELFKRAECFIDAYPYKIIDSLQNSEKALDFFDA